jgi:universal stress protein E
MQNLKSFLLATDFRRASSQAAEVAVNLASAFGSHVSLLHVVDVVPGTPLFQRQYQEQAVELLRQVADQLTARKIVVTAMPIGVGSRADVIVRTADEIRADLILIGAGELLLGDVFSAGSVAESVIEHAGRPVLAIRPGADAVQFTRILCPVDHSTVSRKGLETAIRLAAAFGGKVVVLSVVPPLRSFDKAAIVPPLQWLPTEDALNSLKHATAEDDRNWRSEFVRFLEGIEFGDVSCEKEIRQGDPRAEIVAAARAHHADAIVMGATGRSAVRRLLMGSVTRHVLRQLPCSLLAVKDQSVTS